MQTVQQNPFNAVDIDRYYLWDMLVNRDINAFLQNDWSMVADDFYSPAFIGINAGGATNPDSWKLDFPSLEDYKKSWLADANNFANIKFAEDAKNAIFSATNLRDIEINGDSAVLRKKFDGKILKQDGSYEILNWQTIYHCKKIDTKWKITGFTGYLPNPMGNANNLARINQKIVPQGASQHVTAGPYSPVLEVQTNKLVVISGQAPINEKGVVIGEDIQTQTRFTLENCRKQLHTAGIDFEDIFKVNVFLTDLDLWGQFNEIYKEIMPQPYPVRTAVQTPLLYTFLVEIEMWGIKK